MSHESTGHINTLLLILILAVVIGGGAWLLSQQTPEESAGIEVTIPTGTDNE